MGRSRLSRPSGTSTAATSAYRTGEPSARPTTIRAGTSTYAGAGALSVRNHLAVRDVLRLRPDLRDEYAAAKLALASDPSMDIDTYIARKSGVLQKVLAVAGLTDDELAQVLRLDDPTA